MTDSPPGTPTQSGSETSVVTVMELRPLRRLPSGVYVPILAFFDYLTEDVDLAACQKHVARLLQAGVAGIVVHGSNGEAAHLTAQERHAITQAVADTMRHEHPGAPGPGLPLIAGCGAQSVRETVSLCQDAAKAGATHALVLPPGYYAPLLGRSGLRDFFADVARQSPIPILLYNYPAAANGVDLDSDLILELAREPNIVGVKLTCGNTGKLARVAARVRAEPSTLGDFFVAGGSADFILQGAAVGAHGSIAGLANLAPRACSKILDFHQRADADNARRLQAAVAAADWVAIKYGFVGLKMALPLFHPWASEMNKNPRKPCKKLGIEPWREFMAGVKALRQIEEALETKDLGGDDTVSTMWPSEEFPATGEEKACVEEEEYVSI